MTSRVYLAGPDVFLPEPQLRAAAMKQICARHGLVGVSPLDPLHGEDAALDNPALIALRNETHITDCDAIIANLTPFRGPGADPGTVYEVGFGRALGRPIFGYATVATSYATRVRGMRGSSATHDAEGLAIEDFGLSENLMIACGIESGGGFLLAEDAPDGWADLSVFERCVAKAVALLSRSTARSRTPPAIRLPAAPAE